MRDAERLRRVEALLAATILVAGSAAAGQRRRPAGPRGRFGAAQLKIGQAAPEFVLAPLEFEKDKKGELVGRIGTKKVKLSDFRGKAPVCIFSSSYT